MTYTLTEREYKEMTTLIPCLTYNEIWCTQKGYEFLEKYILVEGSTAYRTIDYPSFVNTPVKIKSWMSDSEALLMLGTRIKANGTDLPLRYEIVGKVRLED